MIETGNRKRKMMEMMEMMEMMVMMEATVTMHLAKNAKGNTVMMTS